MNTQYEKLKQELMGNQYTWLVTGVAGFIGSNLLEELLRLNQKVIGLDNFATGSKENLDDVIGNFSPLIQKNFVFYEGDICSTVDCKKALENVDFVLHQAALGSVPRSIKNPEVTHATNVNGFLMMLNMAKEVGVKRFVYASSSSVYGDSPDLPKKEEKIGNPLSPYAVSKYSNELYAKAFSNCYEIETIGLRYFNVFGPRQNPNGPYAAVIPRWITSLLAKEPVYMYGDGKTTRDFCYIDNAVQANLLSAMAQNPAAVNTVYNIAVGEQNTLNKVYDLIVENFPQELKQELVYQDFRAGDIRHSLAEVDKARNLLAYTPTKRVSEGLKHTVGWYM